MAMLLVTFQFLLVVYAEAVAGNSEEGRLEILRAFQKESFFQRGGEGVLNPHGLHIAVWR